MQTPAPGIPVADPFFAAVRRDGNAAPDRASVEATALVPVGDDAADEVVAAVQARVGFFASELWAAVAPQTDPDPELVLQPAERESEVVVEDRVADPGADGPAALARLGAELEDRGWSVERHDHSLSATLDGSAVAATDTEGFALTVRSAPIPVGAEHARGLVRDGFVD
jgi:hypothetical protein